MRTTLELPDPLFRTLKARAAMDGTSLKDLVIRLVQQGLAQPAPAPGSPRSPFPVLIPGPLGAGVDAMGNAGLYELLDAEDDARAIALMRGDAAGAAK